MGNVLRVDDVYGNDSTATPNGLPYKTIESAVGASTSGSCIWIFPGVYNLSGEIIIPSNVCLRGLNCLTCIIQMIGITSTTTLITIGNNTRIEDLTILMQSNGHYNLTCVEYGGITSTEGIIKGSVITVDNSTALYSGSSNIYGILCSGEGPLVPAVNVFSLNCLKSTTINILSNGSGNKRGIIITNKNVISTRDIIVYVSAPTSNISFGGSYVGVETADPNNLGTIQLRSSTIGAIGKTGLQTYDSSDILQTNPSTVVNPNYPNTPGIQLGSGVELITKSSGNAPFTVYIYSFSFFYGITGSLHDGVNGYMWLGTQAVSNSGNSKFPDPTTPAAYYKFQQAAILCGFCAHLNTGPSNTHITNISVYRTPVGGTITAVPGYLLSFTGSDIDKNYYNSSQQFNPGDFIHVYVSYTGGNSNTTTDMSVQLDVY
jgi:hypothetical protein